MSSNHCAHSRIMIMDARAGAGKTFILAPTTDKKFRRRKKANKPKKKYTLARGKSKLGCTHRICSSPSRPWRRAAAAAGAATATPLPDLTRPPRGPQPAWSPSCNPGRRRTTLLTQEHTHAIRKVALTLCSPQARGIFHVGAARDAFEGKSYTERGRRQLIIFNQPLTTKTSLEQSSKNSSESVRQTAPCWPRSRMHANFYFLVDLIYM